MDQEDDMAKKNQKKNKGRNNNKKKGKGSKSANNSLDGTTKNDVVDEEEVIAEEGDETKPLATDDETPVEAETVDEPTLIVEPENLKEVSPDAEEDEIEVTENKDSNNSAEGTSTNDVADDEEVITEEVAEESKPPATEDERPKEPETVDEPTPVVEPEIVIEKASLENLEIVEEPILDAGTEPKIEETENKDSDNSAEGISTNDFVDEQEVIAEEAAEESKPHATDDEAPLESETVDEPTSVLEPENVKEVSPDAEADEIEETVNELVDVTAATNNVVEEEVITEEVAEEAEPLATDDKTAAESKTIDEPTPVVEPEIVEGTTSNDVEGESPDAEADEVEVTENKDSNYSTEGTSTNDVVDEEEFIAEEVAGESKPHATDDKTAAESETVDEPTPVEETDEIDEEPTPEAEPEIDEEPTPDVEPEIDEEPIPDADGETPVELEIADEPTPVKEPENVKEFSPDVDTVEISAHNGSYKQESSEELSDKALTYGAIQKLRGLQAVETEHNQERFKWRLVNGRWMKH